MHLQQQVERLLKKLYYQPEIVIRGHKMKEKILSCFKFRPYECILHFPPKRGFNEKYFKAELEWYLFGNFDVSFIAEYAKFWKTIANDENKVNSNYGVYVREQFPHIVNTLKKDKYSRQAVISIYNSNHRFINSKDIPCTIYLLFWIRDNYLNMKVSMRSNDIFWGLTYDAPFFSLVQQSLYLLLKDTYPDLKLGWYYHFTDNIHYYSERHEDIAEFIINTNFNEYKILKINNPIFDSYGKVVNNYDINILL